MPSLTRRDLFALTTATAAATLLPTGIAAAGPPSARPAGGHGRPGALTASAPRLHPEGVAWDPTRGAFLVSSARHGTVSVVRRDGSVRTLIADPAMVSTLGVHVDLRRRRVLVAFADLGVGERSASETIFQRSGLGIFDLATGRPLHLVSLTGIPGGHAANDLAIDPAGNAYVTDPAADGVYRVDPAGRVTVLVRDPRLADPNAGLGGIVWHPAGFLLAVAYTTGELWRIGAGGDVRPVDLDRPLVGGDGLALLPSGALVAVTNSVLAPGADAVQTLRGDGGWARARTFHRVAPWPDRAPSTATVTPAGVHVLAGSLDLLFQQGVTADTFTIRRYVPRA
ncbi:MAG TPA: hypothetical protein VES42_00535 [Pilimelia sp.]|nr:hypothetical protein [Pilimelia sp.]